MTANLNVKFYSNAMLNELDPKTKSWAIYIKGIVSTPKLEVTQQQSLNFSKNVPNVV